ADGVRSFVRTRMGGGELKFAGQIAWRATLPASGGRESALWLGPGAHLVTYPLDRSGLLNVVAVTRGDHSGDNWAGRADRRALLRHFDGWIPAVRRMLGAADDWLTWPLYDTEAPVVFG